MALTGSEQMLKGFLMAEFEKSLPNDASKPQTLKNMEKTAEAISNAVVKWILQAGKNAIQAQIQGNGSGTGAGQTAPGQVVVGAPAAIGVPIAGATTSPGAVTTTVTTSVTGSVTTSNLV